MKVIFSRKGSDSGNHNFPSPIFPNGKLLSIPIPSSKDKYTWKDLFVDGIDVQKILKDLHPNLDLNSKLHLDPDLNLKPELRHQDWCPTFGQADSAQGHLHNQGVGKGDVFLFFGWFRHVKEIDGKWEYYGPHYHVLFGWLEIGDVVKIIAEKENAIKKYPWLEQHIHAQYQSLSNTIYIAKKQSVYTEKNNFGGGSFNFSESLMLSAENRTKSVWALPVWFHPQGRKERLSYHPNDANWQINPNNSEEVLLKTVLRGQEFVIDSKNYPELENWVAELIKNHI